MMISCRKKIVLQIESNLIIMRNFMEGHCIIISVSYNCPRLIDHIRFLLSLCTFFLFQLLGNAYGITLCVTSFVWTVHKRLIQPLLALNFIEWFTEWMDLTKIYAHSLIQDATACFHLVHARHPPCRHFLLSRHHHSLSCKVMARWWASHHCQSQVIFFIHHSQDIENQLTFIYSS